ncbi:MAG TPA: TrkA family potassium uptake protein [Candidatus Dormibacteraeota bacterium]|nr:TrkA family potassium uptake protein [Candidatus Dormibacteraeota bacterium]
MYAIVIGGGRVGYFLSRDLLERGDEVTLVENDAARAEWLESQLGSIVMYGDGDEMAFLSTTGIERADAVLAVTGDDARNLVALQLAKKHFNVPLAIARVNNPANVEIFKALGIDEAISATEILLNALESGVVTRSSN